jgi:hypothetical protein
MRKYEFKAKTKELGIWVFGFYVKRGDTHTIIDSNNTVWYIDPSTLCQLITQIGETKIFEYDCFWDKKFNEKFYLYYNELGLLKTNYLFLEKGKTGMIIHDPYVEELINRSKFIGNWHDGEQFLLDKIKELEE